MIPVNRLYYLVLCHNNYHVPILLLHQAFNLSNSIAVTCISVANHLIEVVYPLKNIICFPVLLHLKIGNSNHQLFWFTVHVAQMAMLIAPKNITCWA